MRVLSMACLLPLINGCRHQWMFSVLLLLFTSVAAAEEKNLAELMPRIPSKSVEEAVKSFTLQHGFSMELVASEPLVVDPIDAAFDEQGRIYVVEMNDYPFLPEQRVQKYLDQRSETWGHIRLLTDTDGDGKIDKSVLFADKLRWPQSVCCFQGGVFVLATPNLYYLKDTDHDGVADIKEIVCTGFASANVQGLSNGLEWGRDNAIYFASGMAGGELTVPARDGRPEKKFTPGRRDLRLDPFTRELTMVGGGLQFGHTIDDWGDRFVCSNSSNIVHVTWPLQYLERNPLLAIPDMTRSVAKDGAAAVVFRASSAEPWRLVRTARRAADPEMRKRLPPSELVPIGFFTSATGITVYRGGVYPAEFQGDVFIGDCGGNLIHRKKLAHSGISFAADRADRNVEFMTSTDNWFRPVNFVNAPDGTLYVLDMYRETIEHPVSIPDDIKALVDLESGHDKGRIWRLIPPNYRRMAPPNLATASTVELVGHLRSPHGWIRDNAQRLLVEHNDVGAAGPLRQLLSDNQTTNKTGMLPQTRMHALWTLHGLKSLQPDDIRVALHDNSAFVREHALRLVSSYVSRSPDLAANALSLRDDSSARVLWQLAFTLGDLPSQSAVSGLKSLALKAAADSDLGTAWLSSCHAQTSAITAELLSGDTGPVRPLLVELAKLMGSSTSSTDHSQLLKLVVQDSIPDDTRVSILLAFGEGLRRRGTSISKILEGSNRDDTITKSLDQIFGRASQVARDAGATGANRLSAVKLLALAKMELASPALKEMFTPQTPPELQQAAVKAMAAQGTSNAFETVIESWKGFGPATRREVVDNLIQSSDGATILVKAVESGSIKPGEIERDKRQLLLNHPQTRVRDFAVRVLAETPSNRKQVVASYQTTLELTGDTDRGKMLLTKTCLQCHRTGTAGHQVGPDFASVQNKSPADLLVAILDPNREAQPQFQTYTAVTQQGKIHTGIISAETAASLTLRRAEAKEDVVLRDTLDEMVSNGISLMPEGLEKDITPQQLADIIAALKSGP